MWFVCALRQQSAEWAAECVYGLRVILLAIVLGVLFFVAVFGCLLYSGVSLLLLEQVCAKVVASNEATRWNDSSRLLLAPGGSPLVFLPYFYEYSTVD